VHPHLLLEGFHCAFQSSQNGWISNGFISFAKGSGGRALICFRKIKVQREIWLKIFRKIPPEIERYPWAFIASEKIKKLAFQARGEIVKA
jgi:hypothetical protein